jgi:predicted nucleic acid-binding protein
MAAVRAVLDTNVVVAAHRSSGTASPNREVLTRWKASDFTLLYSEDVLLEYVEKLIEFAVPDEKLQQFVSAVGGLGEAVPIAFFHLRRYPADADDIAFLLCAINGNATHLVTYDSGFAVIAPDCSFAICQPLAFLAALRAALTP